MIKILNHPAVVIDKLDENGYQVSIKLSNGDWLINAPYESSLMGLVGAMMLATDVLSGKYYPVRVVKDNNPNYRINHSPELLEAQKGGK